MEDLNEALTELLEALKAMKSVMVDVSDSLQEAIELLEESDEV